MPSRRGSKDRAVANALQWSITPGVLMERCCPSAVSQGSKGYELLLWTIISNFLKFILSWKCFPVPFTHHWYFQDENMSSNLCSQLLDPPRVGSPGSHFLTHLAQTPHGPQRFISVLPIAWRPFQELHTPFRYCIFSNAAKVSLVFINLSFHTDTSH